MNRLLIFDKWWCGNSLLEAAAILPLSTEGETDTLLWLRLTVVAAAVEELLGKKTQNSG